MKTLYEAASAIEAHMILDLLKQEGVTAHILGEHLQGAIGELPAGGLVRLTVNEADYAQGRSVIERWDAKQPKEIAQKVVQTKFKTLYGFLAGLTLGVGCSYAYFRVPTTVEGIDYDRNGVLDEKWTYSASRTALKLESDRNLDGKIDYVAHYDERGQVESATSDDNFDGVFETQIRFRRGNIESSATDTDGDGYPDLRSVYSNGVSNKTEYINPLSGLPLRVEHFKFGILRTAEMDTDKDGKLDTRYQYNALAQVISTDIMAK
jgi:Putative prokaryotic signal transducing protein